VRASAGRLGSAGLLVSALAACIPEGGTGFVQIKTVPASSVSQPSLYLDSVKLEPLKKGAAVLSRKAGTSKLQAEVAGGQLALLCDIVVKKNRITTVTISTVERPPRCQCTHNANQGSQANRTCIG
jgi:hypothetical protein